MHFKQFYLGCLAQASYLIGSDGEAAVVDPRRDVDEYLDEAAALGLTIRWVIETHLHADFVSGHRELAERTGATIVIGARAGATFPHRAARDGDRIPVGRLVLRDPGDAGAHPRQHLRGGDRPRGLTRPAHGPHRRHALRGRRGPSGPGRGPGLLHRGDGGDALRLAPPQASPSSRRGGGVSGPRGGVPVRAQHLPGELLHDRRAASLERGAPGHAPGRVRALGDHRSAGDPPSLRPGRGQEPRGSGVSRRPSDACRSHPRGRGPALRRRRRDPRRPPRAGLRGGARARLGQHRPARRVRALGGSVAPRRAAHRAGRGRGRPGPRGGHPPGPGGPGERGGAPRRGPGGLGGGRPPPAAPSASWRSTSSTSGCARPRGSSR